MNKQKSIMIAVAGVTLLAASQVRAQLGYSADDLLLNFRNTANVTGNDLEVNAGPISTLAAYQGPTEVLVASSLVEGVYGAPSDSVPVGFSASAGDFTSGTLWLSRADTTPGTAPASESSQAALSTQQLVVTDVNNIGTGGNAGTSDGSGAATVTGATSGNSYQAQGEENTTVAGQAIINFGSHENVAASKGGNIEGIQDGSGAVYEALWDVPVGTSSSTSDTYLGYFTFDADGEVDYTPAVVTVVPEPSTYGVLAATGLLALALRRQIGSLIA